MTNESIPRTYEGTFSSEGGGFTYTPLNETDPATILASAKRAAHEHKAFNTRDLCVLIPVDGRLKDYTFDEHTTIEDFPVQDKRIEMLGDTKDALVELSDSLEELTSAQLEEVLHFTEKLKENR